MKMKKLIVLVLICSLLTGQLLCGNATMAASTQGGSTIIYEYGSYENPVYAGSDNNIISDEVALPVMYSGETLGTYDEMVDYIRNNMRERNTNVTFTYMGSFGNLAAKELVSKAIEDAYSDDDNALPYEGDYIYYSFSGYSFSLSISGNRFTADITFRYHTTSGQEQEVTERVNSLLASWDTSSMSDMQKVKLVHDYIVTNVEYDYSYSKYSAYNALIEGSSVCQGYALLTYRMLRGLGLQTRIISGLGNSDRHAWNIVKIGNKYYNIDCTWDSNWSEYDTAAGEWKIDYHCYLLSDEDFVNHKRDSQFLTEEFTETHPMYMQSYYDDNEVNAGAGAYNFTTTSGRALTDSYDGITILVMGGITINGTETVLKSVAAKGVDNIEGVRVVAVDINGNSDTVVAGKINGISQKITACYDENISAKRTMFALAEKAGLLNSDGTVNVPVTIVIDSDNNIRYGYTGSAVSGGRLLNCIYNLKPEIRPEESPVPATKPTATPAVTPTTEPTATPKPSSKATLEPAATPSVTPTTEPSVSPSGTPSTEPSATPTTEPGVSPSGTPSAEPGETPSVTPTTVPSTTPSGMPSAAPTATSSATPTTEPGETPSGTPGTEPSATPTTEPSTTPSATPSATPSVTPSATPSAAPSVTPSAAPTAASTHQSTAAPDSVSNAGPSSAPIVTLQPSTLVGKTFKAAGLRYKVTSDGESRTVRCMGAVKKNIKNLVIPATVKYRSKSFKVTVINAGAFKNNRSIRKLTVGKNVITIMNKAFYRCSKLKKVVIRGRNLKNIGKNAFVGFRRKDILG